MFKVLVVDDEPRVSAGIKNVLLASNLNITHVETALNGFEAIDYLRMDVFDLVLTDIQMSRMSGLELMETIYMEQPHLPVIVISAHEKFDFAKKSLRLGARDYLVKPVELNELLRIVGRVLHEKEELGKQSLERTKREGEEEKTGAARRNELLLELVTERNLAKADYEDLIAELGGERNGCHYGVISVRLDLSSGGFSKREVRLQDRKLLKYATVNVMEESLQEWNGLIFNGYGNELVGILQLNVHELADEPKQLQSQLHLIGQIISMNVRQYLNVDATVGMSRLSEDVFMLPKLMEEANAAAEWRKLHPGQKVFYYEDVATQENLNITQWMAKVDEYIQTLKSANGASGFVNHAAMVRTLRELDHSEELMNSCLGMLAYRVYGLVLEQGHSHGVQLQRFDPAVYFQGNSRDEKLAKLADYLAEAEVLIYELGKERDQSILARITGYIRQHYRNPALKIQDIASEVHFSTAYLGYLFKREMKKNLWDYVTELRIEEAKRLLTTTDKKRYEVAYEVGYESPEHFSRMFKRYAGVSPAEFRKEA